MCLLRTIPAVFILSSTLMIGNVSGNHYKNEIRINQKPNILFISIDDIGSELVWHSFKIAITSNIDYIANKGLKINRAYCQQTICSLSEERDMKGARLESINVFENCAYFKDIHPYIVTLPRQFKSNEYETAYCGKIYQGKFTDEELSSSRQPAIDNVSDEKPKLICGHVFFENQQIYYENQEAMKANYGDVNHSHKERGLLLNGMQILWQKA